MASSFVDRVAGLGANVGMKAPCVTASTAPIALSGLFAINGVTPVEGARVLVNGQSNEIENGIWLASVNDWVRAADAAGMKVIAYPNRHYRPADAELALADRVVESLHDVQRAVREL